MKAQQVVGYLAIGLVIAVIGYRVLSALAAAHAYSGPGIQGNLLVLEVAKARWVAAHKGGDEWPTLQEVLPYLTNGMAKFSIRPVDKEIYIINKVGAPVYAYVPKTERLYSVDTNKWELIKQMED